MTDIRPTATYSTYRGETCTVAGPVTGAMTTIRRPGRSGTERVPTADLGSVERVVTTATWRGGRVYVGRTDGTSHQISTYDDALARREGLAGDQHSGWHGSAEPDELSDVEERVTPRPRGGPAAREDDA